MFCDSSIEIKREKEADMAPWTSGTAASSTASYHQSHYYSATATATATATAFVMANGYHYWRATSTTTATAGTSTSISPIRGYGSDEYVYVDNIHISRVHLTHHQAMQLKINAEWEKYCREERLAEERKRYRIEVIEREAAENKAVILLESFIGNEQIEVYKKTGKMYVKGENGLYIAKKGGGIQKVEGSKVINYCVHLEAKWKCPPTDEVVAMKFLLEHDDSKIIKMANWVSETEHEDGHLPIAACM